LFASQEVSVELSLFNSFVALGQGFERLLKPVQLFLERTDFRVLSRISLFNPWMAARATPSNSRVVIVLSSRPGKERGFEILRHRAEVGNVITLAKSLVASTACDGAVESISGINASSRNGLLLRGTPGFWHPRTPRQQNL
jgi:hypothetical protein